MHRLRTLWWGLKGSLWFVPSLMVLVAGGLAAALVAAEGALGLDLAGALPRLFGAGAEGARAMLSAIAGSMITVAGVVFSVTLVALSLAATQYSPRVIRTFMHDRPTQSVLGVFVGVFVYCLIVLRTIRGGDDGSFVPSLAVFGGMVFALVAIGFLVFFIHHLAGAIEASSILARLALATTHSIDVLYPPLEGSDAENEEAGRLLATRITRWIAVPADCTGYIVSVDKEGLRECARSLGCVVRMESTTGDFVIQGQPLVSLSSGTVPTKEQCAALNNRFSVDRLRTIEQDVAYGLQQIVDVALKALSPGINDQTTAIMCIDRIGEIMVRLADRRVQENYFLRDSTLELIAADRSYESFLHLAFDAVRIAAAAHRQVLERLAWALERVQLATRDPQRLLLAQAMARRLEAALRSAPQ
jgi:uncharacterized membrane protein